MSDTDKPLSGQPFRFEHLRLHEHPNRDYQVGWNGCLDTVIALRDEAIRIEEQRVNQARPPASDRSEQR